MDKVESWPFIQDFFNNRTKGSFKVTDLLAVDHDDKLKGAGITSPYHAGLHAEWLPFFVLWKSAWNKWHNTYNEWHSCTHALELLLSELLESPGGDGRSLLDSWESRFLAHWSASSTMYQHCFPEGRAAFTTGAREATIQAVHQLHTRLLEKLSPLQQEQTNLQNEVNALLGAGQPVPAQLQARLDAANARVVFVDTLAAEVGNFHTTIHTARSAQQNCEGAITPATVELEKQRIRISRRMLLNFHDLATHYLRADFEAEDAQYAAAGFYDLTILMRPKSEDPPDVPPPPAPAPGPPP